MHWAARLKFVLKAFPPYLNTWGKIYSHGFPKLSASLQGRIFIERLRESINKTCDPMAFRIKISKNKRLKLEVR